jgi:pseudoazurin|tara:strand:+ start:2200 stop:2670 length:471 start_codon:yes stop_codon:yes gene_type:complete
MLKKLIFYIKEVTQMKYILLSFLILFSFSSNNAFSNTIEIEMLNRSGKNIMAFSKRVVNVDIGDKIFWKATNKGHNVEFVSFPKGVKVFKSKLGKDTSFDFTIPGIYLYQCTPHKMMGMIGIVVVGKDYSNLEIIKKSKMIGKSKKTLKQLILEIK